MFALNAFVGAFRDFMNAPAPFQPRLVLRIENMFQTKLYSLILGARAEKVVAVFRFDSINGLCSIIASAPF
jgi:hypothetical protein